MKRLISKLLVFAFLLSMLPLSVFAAWTTTPTVTLSASELVDNKFAVTITVSSSKPSVKAFNFGIIYDPELVEVDSTAGSYKGWNADDEEFNVQTELDITATVTTSFQRKPVLEVAGKTMYFIADASTTGYGQNGFTATVHYKLTEKAISEGGKADFTLANGTGTVGGNNVALFDLGAGDDRIEYPTVNNSVSIAIPIKSIALTATVTTPVKGAADASSVTAGTGYTGAVTWAPALTGGKFAADTAYTATVTLTPANGYAFASNMTVTGLNGFTFAKSGNYYIASKTYPKTDDKELTGIEVTTQPTKKTYTHGDVFDPTGMVVKATYDDGSVDSAFTGYIVSYANGNYLRRGDAKVTLSADSKKVDVTGLTVNAKELTISGLTATSRAYDGKTSVNLTGGTLNGKVGSEAVSVTMPTAGTISDANFGTGKAVAVDKPELTGTDAGNYTLADITGVTVDITRAEYTYTYGKDTDTAYIGADLPKESEAKAVGVNGEEVTGTLSWYTDPACTQAATGTFTETGSKTLYWKFVPAVNDVNANYVTDAETGSVVYTVSALPTQEVKFQYSSVGDKTYGDGVFLNQATNDTPVGGAITYSSSNTDVAEVNASTGAVTIKGAGTATITATAAEVALTFAETSESYTLTVAPKTVGLTWFGYTGLTYDGKAKNVTATATDLIGGDECTVTVTGGTETNAGDHTATASGLSNKNYKLPDNDTQAYTITQKNLSGVTIASVSALTYNGDEQKPEPAVSFNNGTADITLAKGTDFTYSYSNNTNKGTATVTITAVDGGNYTGTNSASFTINAKSVTATAGTLVVTKKYDGNTAAGTVESGALALTGVVGSDEVTVSGTVGAYASADYGTGINVTITGLTLDGADKDNYVLSATEGTFVVGKITKIRVKAEDYMLNIPKDAVYNGEAQPLTAEKVTYAIGDLTVLYNGSATAPKAAGTYAVTLKVAASTNYEAETGIEIGEYVIAQKEAALVWDNYADLVYDGNAKNVTTTVSNLVGSDSCTVTVTGGTEKDAGTYTATATALSNKNYKLPDAVTQEYKIAPKTLTKDDLEYKSGATTKVYDGTTDAADIVVGVKSGVLASGDTLEIKGAAAYDSKDITATKIIFTPTAITEDNYRLAETETVEIPATITAKELTITGVKAVDRSYKEGETTVELTGGELVGVVKDEVVTINLGSGTMANDDVGARKAVTTAIEHTGAYAANYTLTQPTDVTVNIMAEQTIAVNAETGKDKTQVDTLEGATQDVADTAKAVYNISVDTQAVAIMQEASNAAVSDADKVKAIIESAKNNETIKALLEADNGITEADIQIAAVPFIAIEVKAADLTTGGSEIKLEIDFKLQIKATVGDLSNPEETVKVGEPETMTVNKPIVLEIPLPDGFVTGETAFIKHIHDGKTYVYIGTVSGNKLSFTSLFGLSEFTIVPTLDTVAKIERPLGTLYFETLQAAVDEVQNGETITLMANAEAATVSREITFTVDPQGFDYSITIGNGYSRAETEGSTYTINKDNTPTYSGGGVSSGYTVTVNATTNGTVTTSRKSASSGSTVTLTVTPNAGYQLNKLTVLDKNGKEVELKDLGNGKFSFKMPNGKVSISASFAEIPAEEPPADEPAFVNPFTDVSETDYYYDAVLWAAENGIALGTSETTFSPEAPVTRAQTVTFLWRAAGCPEPTGDASRFADVEAGSYYEKAVAWAIEQGITQGMTETTFNPNDICTRAQTVTFLSRFAGVTAAETESEFSDVAATDYFAAAVKWAKDNGVTAGTTETTFSPNDDCIRAQTVTFLYRWMVR